MKSSIVKGLIVSGIALSGLVFAEHEANAAGWKANTPDQIQIVNGQKEYTMKLGDTLWAIGQKVNINHVKLAEINGINLNAGEQYRLPVGRVINFEGNVVTVKEANGKVVSQAVIQDKDKIDNSKPAGQSVQEDKTHAATLPQPDPDLNNSGHMVQDPNYVAPSESADSGGQSETPVTPTEPVEPTEPETPVTPEKDMTPINLGNSGREFDTKEEARAYAYAQTHDETSQYNGWGYEIYDLFAKDNVPLGTFTVRFYQ